MQETKEAGSMPALGRSLGEGGNLFWISSPDTGSLLQYSGLENSMDCIVHGVTKSGKQLSDSPSSGWLSLEASISR